jgi:F0F1-type ATP synthase assembly protein I
MTKDTTTSSYHFKNASCYGDATIEDRSAMQRPLLEDMEALIPQELLQEQDEKNVTSHPPAVSTGFRIRFVLIGFVFGIITQAVTFGSFEILLRRWGRNAQPESHFDFFFYFMLMVLSRIDIVVNLAIPIGFAFFSTRQGALYFRKMFDREEASSMSRLPAERFVFVLSVSFFTGVLLGSFLGWLVVDILKGLPMKVLPFLTMVICNVVIYYLLLRSYDWVEDEEESEEDEPEDQQQAEVWHDIMY